MRKHSYLLVLTALFAIFGLWACSPDDVARTTETTRSSGSHRNFEVESFCEDTTGGDTVDTYWNNYEDFQEVNTMLAKAMTYYLNDDDVAFTVVQLINRDAELDWTDYSTLLSEVHDTLFVRDTFNLADSVYVKLVGLGHTTGEATIVKNFILNGYMVVDDITFYGTISLPFLDETVFEHGEWNGFIPERCVSTLSGWASTRNSWQLDSHGDPEERELEESEELNTPMWTFGLTFKTTPPCWVIINIMAPLAPCFCASSLCGSQTYWICSEGGGGGRHGCGRSTLSGCSGSCGRTDQLPCN